MKEVGIYLQTPYRQSVIVNPKSKMGRVYLRVCGVTTGDRSELYLQSFRHTNAEDIQSTRQTGEIIEERGQWVSTASVRFGRQSAKTRIHLNLLK